MNYQRTLRRVAMALTLLVAFLFQGTWALAGTTGGLSGTVTDKAGAPVVGAIVKVSSPSEVTVAMTDAHGHFSFISLQPDTFTVTVSKVGYNTESISGVTVFADQSFALSVVMHKALKTIATVKSVAAGNLVKSGTTASVYAVNSATQTAVQGMGGGYNLDSAYSAIYSQPGVNSFIGNSGFGQVFYIRGAAYGQTGYEYDGVPVNRAFDNYSASSLSSLGTQQTQIYTGGSAADAGSATLGGYINQVIKTGTYPGTGTLIGGIGAPGFYHKLAVEVGGATPNRLFSYYVALGGTNQELRFINNQDGGNIATDGSGSLGLSTPSVNPVAGFNTNFFGNGPWSTCTASGAPPAGAASWIGAFFGSDATAPACQTYAPYNTAFGGTSGVNMDRENVVNLHFAIPHKSNAGRDDVQFLYNTFAYHSQYVNSIGDAGGQNFMNSAFYGWGGANGYAQQTNAAMQFFLANNYISSYGNPTGPLAYTGQGGPYDNVCSYAGVFQALGVIGSGCSVSGGSVMPYNDGLQLVNSSFGQPASAATVGYYFQPSSGTQRQVFAGLPINMRDGIWNDGSIVKLQYQKNIDENSYLRVMGYTYYSDWLMTAPVGTGFLTGYDFVPGALGLAGAAPDYELNAHTRGGMLQYANQINDKNLLNFTYNYVTSTVGRMNNEWYGAPGIATNLVDKNGVCYDSQPTIPNAPGTPGTSPNPDLGNPVSCLSGASQGTLGSISTAPGTYGQIQPNLTPGVIAGQALANGAQWLVTRPGGYGPQNNVTPVFTNISLSDNFQPNRRWNFNLGVRYEKYQYNLVNYNNAEYQFWFNAAANSYCYDPSSMIPYMVKPSPASPPSAAGPAVLPNNSPLDTNAAGCYSSPGVALTNSAGQQYLHPNGLNGNLLYQGTSVPSLAHSVFSPRFAGTYTINPDTIIRFSAGQYTQPTETAFEQYGNLSGYGAAKFDFSHFWQYGFTSTVHDNPVQRSENYDISLEKHFKGTDLSFKLTPFYRYTLGQTVNILLSPGFISGINAGTQKTTGVELAIQKGDPSRNGLSGQLNFTYTHARIQYQNLAGGQNAISFINSSIVAFNDLTKYCSTAANAGDPRCSGAAGSSLTAATQANIAPCYAANGAGLNGTNGPDPTCAATSIANPYWNANPQALLQTNGWYPTYANQPPSLAQDNLQTAFGPIQIGGFLNYKKNKTTLVAAFQLVQGARYGSPLDSIGVDPRTCGSNQASLAPTVAVGAAYQQLPNYQSCGASPFTANGILAIPNPTTGTFDGEGQYREPWQFNLSLQGSYNINRRMTATLTLANVVNRCFGGSSTPWSAAYAPGSIVCGYSSNGSYIGNPSYSNFAPGSGFFYGASGSDPANGTAGYPGVMNQAFAPYSGGLPLQAYLEVQFKL